MKRTLSAQTIIQRLLNLGRPAALLALLLALPACQRPGASPSGQTSEVAGVYQVISVDGKPVPTKIQHEGATLEIRSGSFIISTNGQCVSKMVFVPPSGKEVTREVTATYTRQGNNLDMRWKGAGRTTGKVEGNTFTMANEGMLIVYRK